MKLPVQQSSSYPASLAPKTFNNHLNANNKQHQPSFIPTDLNIQAVYVMPKVKISKQDIENLLKQQ